MSSSAASSGGGGSSLYDTLGVAATVPPEEVRKSYRKLVLTCHPDKIRDEALRPEAEKRFQAIVTAYEVLSDAVKRSEYDRRTRANGAESRRRPRERHPRGAHGRDEARDSLFRDAWGVVRQRRHEVRAVRHLRRHAPSPPRRPARARRRPCAACDARAASAPVPCAKCDGAAPSGSFFPRPRRHSPGRRRRARIALVGRSIRAVVRVMPSKLFARDGANISSVWSSPPRKRGRGDSSTWRRCRAPETVFVDEGAKTGGVKVIEGKRAPEGRRGR